MTNLVTTTPTRFAVIRPDLLPPMKVLESISTEVIIASRMAKFKALWASYDPPNAAQYDLENLEFDPIKIQAELATFFELLVRDRVNQAARAVTLAYAVGSDLDAIGSRYPYGVARLDTNGDGIPDETDAAYRQRLWLSPNILSLNGPGQGTYESYVFWALSAPQAPELPIKHATALTVEGTGNVIIPIINSIPLGSQWIVPPAAQNSYVLAVASDPTPTANQIANVYKYITEPDMARKGLTDVINVVKPKITNTAINVQVWLFPGVDRASLMAEVCAAVLQLIVNLRWIGADLTILALETALGQAGVYNTVILSPAADVIVGVDGCVNITTATLVYMGIGE
jgi:phage-related baseplate assembly protein